MKVKGLWLGLMLLLLLWPATAVIADEPGLHFDGGDIFVEKDVTLERGETVDGDLGVFDGDLHLPEGSAVNGDVFVANGDVYVAGTVNGNLAVMEGDLELSETGLVAGDMFAMSGDQDVAGHVRGDLSALFGDMRLRSTAIVDGNLLVAPGVLKREAGAQVRGEEVHDLSVPPIPFIEGLPQRVPIPTPPERLQPPEPQPLPQRVPHRATLGSRIGSFIGRSLTAAFLSLVFIAVGALIVFIWPRPTQRVSECVAAMPVQALGIGLLSFIIAACLEALAVVLMILVILVAAALIATVILIPVGLLLILLSVLVLLPVPLALAGAMVLGWVGVAELIGRKALKVLRVRNVAPLGAVVAGLLITVPIAATLWIAKPLCCAWPFIILLTSVGLGAVIHTRFGTQSCGMSGAASGPEVLPIEAMDEEAGLPDNANSDTP
jgi:cytoskeletal protein CcmA (bactofilin family)